MKALSLAALGLVLAAGAGAGGAMSAEPLTRAEVRADTLAASRAGDIPFGDLDTKPSDIDPRRYPMPPAAPGVTRAQVRQELAAAVAAGDLPLGDTGETRHELLAAHAAHESAVGLTRAQVNAETLRAIRLGQLEVGDSGQTAAQINPPAYAKAAGPTVVAHGGR